MKRWFVAALAVGAVLAVAPHAHAEETCPNAIDGGAEVDAIDATTRARWLRTTLDSERARAAVWTWGWAGAGLAGTGVNVALGATSDYSARVDRFGAAAGTTALTLTTLIDPLRVPGDDGGGDLCESVKRRERVLLAAANDEFRRQGLLGHALPIGGSIAGGLVLGIGYGHWSGGALNAAIGIVVSEIKMFTQPMGAPRGLARYRAGLLGTDGARVGVDVAPMLLGKGGAGLAFSLSY